jgi:hypothetical protein
MLKRFRSVLRPQTLLGAGVALPGVSQQGGDTTVQTLTTLLVLVTCILPILMAIFGAIVMRFLAWFTSPPQPEDEVVYPKPTLPPGIHLPEPTIWPAALAFGLMGLMFAIPLEAWAEAVALVFGAVLTLLGLGGWVVVEVKEFRVRRSE